MDKDLNTGIFLISKPQGISSFQALYPIKKIFKGHRVGHAGTLDVEAKGLLVVAVGKATRLIDLIQAKFKTYDFKIILGMVSDSYDIFTEITKTHKKYDGSLENIQKLVNRYFIGKIKQTPPIFSSVKYKGKRAYKLARQGLQIKLEPKNISIQLFEIIKYSFPEIECRVICSKGTYIRSLAHDLGLKLGCGGVADQINRIKIGEFSLKDAVTVDEICSQDKLHPIECYFKELDAIEFDDEQIKLMVCGQKIKYPLSFNNETIVKIFNSEKKWIALGIYISEYITLKSMLTIL